MLDEYGTESWQREPDRVRLAVLKLMTQDAVARDAQQSDRDGRAPGEALGLG